MYDFIVIGKGLMGSAAFRHLSEYSANTLLIGPDEPSEPTTHGGVFGAHYDEARLTHLHGKSPVWGELCRRSIGRYRGLEARSGIPFYQPIGELYIADAGMVNTYNDRDNIQNSRDALGAELIELGPAAKEVQFPFLALPVDSYVLWEQKPAGYINPRAMLRAQVRLGEQVGGKVVSEIVVAPKIIVITWWCAHRTMTNIKRCGFSWPPVRLPTASPNCPRSWQSSARPSM